MKQTQVFTMNDELVEDVIPMKRHRMLAVISQLWILLSTTYMNETHTIQEWSIL